jgi:hypothetical protein
MKRLTAVAVTLVATLGLVALGPAGGGMTMNSVGSTGCCKA